MGSGRWRVDNGWWGVDSERGIVEKSIPVLKETEKRPWSGWWTVGSGWWTVDGG